MNSLRFLSVTIHGALDYIAAAGLVVFPILLGFSGLPLWLSVAGGIGLAVYSFLTDYAFGVVRVIPFKVHTALDLSAAVAFIAAPFVFGWTGLVFAYYLVMAAGVIVVVALTDTSAHSADDAGLSVNVQA